MPLIAESSNRPNHLSANFSIIQKNLANFHCISAINSPHAALAPKTISSDDLEPVFEAGMPQSHDILIKRLPFQGVVYIKYFICTSSNTTTLDYYEAKSPANC
jgi:hypothetical protein